MQYVVVTPVYIHTVSKVGKLPAVFVFLIILYEILTLFISPYKWTAEIDSDIWWLICKHISNEFTFSFSNRSEYYFYHFNLPTHFLCEMQLSSSVNSLCEADFAHNIETVILCCLCMLQQYKCRRRTSPWLFFHWDARDSQWLRDTSS